MIGLLHSVLCTVISVLCLLALPRVVMMWLWHPPELPKCSGLVGFSVVLTLLLSFVLRKVVRCVWVLTGTRRLYPA